MKDPTSRRKTTKTAEPAKKGYRRKTGASWPVHYSETDIAAIKAVQKNVRGGDVLSVSEINARAIRFAVPKFLSGEIDILSVKPIDLPADAAPASSTAGK